MSRVCVVDYGRGNLFSVARALEVAGAEVCLSRDIAEIVAADRLVLPGVGAFGDAMANLIEPGLDEAIRRFAERQRPLLGICLGMQMLAETSQEFGTHQGLGLIAGSVEKLPQRGDGLPKVPNVGWCRLDGARPWAGSVLAQTAPGTYAYFVHSFHFVAAHDDDVLATYNFGGHAVAAVVRAGSVTGCQFHPEKSGPAGAQMIKSWLEE